MFFVKDYIQKGSSHSDAVERCMRARKAVRKRETVVFSGQDFCLDRAVLIPSDTEIIIDGCTVTQENEVFDNIFRGDNLVIDPANPFGEPLEASTVENITIRAVNGGMIAGPEVRKKLFHPEFGEEQEAVGDFWGWRTFLICLSLCKGFEIAGLVIRRTNCWAMSFDGCSYGYIHDIDIVSECKNGDGIDFRAGCRHCRVKNITGYTSDDTVACTAQYSVYSPYPKGKYLYPLCPTRKLRSGSPEECNIEDITIEGIYTGGRHHAVICLCSGGAQVSHVRIKDVKETAEGERECAVRIYTGYGNGYRDGDLHDISVDDVECSVSALGVYCNTKVSNVKLGRIKCNNKGGQKFKLDFPDGIITEDF